jgi:hypothetical protein
MKLVREHINEVFTDESDPIKDMGIGIVPKIEKWIEKNMIIDKNSHNTSHLKINVNDFPPYIINSEGEIDVYGSLYKIYETALYDFPSYIQFNEVFGYCDIAYTSLIFMKGFPRIVHGYFRCSSNKLTSLEYSPIIVYNNYYPGHNPGNFTVNDVKKVCKVKGFINLEKSY